MKKIYILPFMLLILFGCQNENTLLYDFPDEAIIGLKQQTDFVQNIQILGQNSYSDTYYFVFEGNHNNEMEWYIADVKKDKKDNAKWYVDTSINLGSPSTFDENSKAGISNYLARLIPKNQILQDHQIIIETTDPTYNVLVEFKSNK